MFRSSLSLGMDGKFLLFQTAQVIDPALFFSFSFLILVHISTLVSICLRGDLIYFLMCKLKWEIVKKRE